MSTTRLSITQPNQGTYIKSESIPADEFGRPNLSPPDVVDQDNVTLYAFTVNTDSMTFKFPTPADLARGSNLDFIVLWTNDNGVDDNGKNVKWQLSYQTGSEGDPVSGSHANSPKTVEDAYTSDAGSIECRAAPMTIANADFAGETCIYIKLMAITAPATWQCGEGKTDTEKPICIISEI